MKHHFRVWWLLIKQSTQYYLVNRLSSVLFIIGKLVRFSLFSILLFSITQKTNQIGQFSSQQLLFSFLIFNFLDTLSQLLFRAVYTMRPHIVSGSFDYFLLQPISPAFRALLGSTDLLDLVTLIIFIALTVGYLFIQNLVISPQNFLIFIILVFSALIISAAIHLATVSVGIFNTAVDHSIMIFRILSRYARIPINLYPRPVAIFLTYIIPIGIMFTWPAQALLGIFSPIGILASLFIAFLSLFLSLKFWRFALKHYSSASS